MPRDCKIFEENGGIWHIDDIFTRKAAALEGSWMYIPIVKRICKRTDCIVFQLTQLYLITKRISNL